MQNLMLILICVLTCIISRAANADGLKSDGQPNFVVILADDQGWNATSTPVDPNIPSSGSTYYQTPNLDKLISEGVCFSRAYSSSPTCGPSRHSIQFGRSPVSLQIFASTNWGIESFAGVAAESMANTLTRAHPDYVTAHFGKWHIRQSPKVLGYDFDDGNNGNGEGNSKDPKDPKQIFSRTKKGNDFMEGQV